MGEAMKYRYRFKNPRIEKAVFALFDEYSIKAAIDRQMNNDSNIISLANCWPKENKTKIHEELQENIGLIGRIDFAKSELEEILEYDPNGWNPYPKVLPPEGKSYLVQVFDSNIEKNKLWVLEWSVSNQWWCSLVDKDDGFNFVAFRELPELYKPEAQE